MTVTERPLRRCDTWVADAWRLASELDRSLGYPNPVVRLTSSSATDLKILRRIRRFFAALSVGPERRPALRAQLRVQLRCSGGIYGRFRNSMQQRG